MLFYIGVRLYAHTIARMMDKDEKYFSHRILSRDELVDANTKKANLKYAISVFVPRCFLFRFYLYLYLYNMVWFFAYILFILIHGLLASSYWFHILLM